MFKLTAEFTPSMTSGHYRFPFTIEKPCNGITIRYRYAPKTLQDAVLSAQLITDCYARYGLTASDSDIAAELPLNNHITLSLDSPAGLVGTAHRHANDTEFTIGANYSTEGFNKTHIAAGEWAVVLSTHAVLSDKVLAEVQICTQ